ncbi:MAG: hypothetical protein AAGA84_00745 [Pseudomonadota bacterium]
MFEKTFIAHGGEYLDELEDVSVALDGEWKFLITRIQPLVTDHRYRVVSEERLIPKQGAYAAQFVGPAGVKKVVRTPEKIRVFYDGEESFDADVLASTALTADSFFLFTLGPLALGEHRGQFQRLQDAREGGRTYYRIYSAVSPGIGVSEQDEIVLWVDQETNLTYRIHITLEGYKTTQGAHVDVSFVGYQTRGPFILASRFSERVLGPIKIKAHDWYLTGLDINRGMMFDSLDGPAYSGAAAKPATALQP